MYTAHMPKNTNVEHAGSETLINQRHFNIHVRLINCVCVCLICRHQKFVSKGAKSHIWNHMQNHKSLIKKIIKEWAKTIAIVSLTLLKAWTFWFHHVSCLVSVQCKLSLRFLLSYSLCLLFCSIPDISLWYGLSDELWQGLYVFGLEIFMSRCGTCVQGKLVPH